MAIIEQVFANFQQGSILRLVVPFLLVFTLLYGILRRIGIFNGGDNAGSGRRIDIAVSTLGALIVVGYTPFVEGVFYAYLTNIFGAVAVLLIAILAFHIIEQMATGGVLSNSNSILTWGVGAIVLMLFIGYGGPRMLGVDRYPNVDIPILMTTTDFIILLFFAAVIGAMYWIVSEEEGKKPSPRPDG